MLLKISFTDNNMDEEFNKTLCEFKDGQLFLSNIVDIKHVNFFNEILPEFSQSLLRKLMLNYLGRRNYCGKKSKKNTCRYCNK